MKLTFLDVFNGLMRVGVPICLVALLSSTASADRFFGFNNLSGIGPAVFVFENEQVDMDVSYEAGQMSASGGILRCRAGRRTGQDTFGVWARTPARIIPPNTVMTTRARVNEKGDGSANAWHAVWGLYSLNGTNHESFEYLENDLVETFPQGNGFNRYVNRDPVTRAVDFTGGQSAVYQPTWRQTYRTYRANMRVGRTTFSVSGRSRVLRNGRRNFNQRLHVTSRPWGGTYRNVSVNTRVGDLNVDWVNLDSP